MKRLRKDATTAHGCTKLVKVSFGVFGRVTLHAANGDRHMEVRCESLTRVYDDRDTFIGCIIAGDYWVTDIAHKKYA